MKYKLLLLYLVCISTSVFSQKEDHQWIFNFTSIDDVSMYPDFGACILDFNQLPPVGIAKPEITLDVKECHASMCDQDGKLMLYSNGQSIHDSNHIPIIGGDTINFSLKWHGFLWRNEHGEQKPSGMRGVQGVGFIPQPETDTILALYHNYEHYEQGDPDSGYLELWMSQLVPDGLGSHRVINRDSLINPQIFKFGTITACRHANGRDWWMLQFSRDTVYHYLIDPSGLNLDHMSTLPFELRGTIGQSKFSPQGDRFALYGSWDLSFLGAASRTDLMVADFDRCSGDLIDPIFSLQPGQHSVFSNGVEFSPDGNLLYISNKLNMYQFDLNESDVFSSRQTVATYDGSTCGDAADFPLEFGQLKLGPDNKIYIGLTLQCFDIHVINYPNNRGTDCDVQQNVIKLPTYTYGTIPNFNTYRLGPLDGSFCDTLGIDNQPISRFWFEQDSLDFLSVQFWDVSYFRPEEWRWDFGDGTSSTERFPVHSFSQNGVYDVCLTVSNENSSNTSCQTLNIGTTSTTENAVDIDFTLFPNPTQDVIRCQLQNYLPRDGRIMIYNSNGHIMLTEKIRVGATNIDLTNFEAGIYFYELREGNKKIKSGKIVKL